MARSRKKSDPSVIRFGSMPFKVEATIESFTDPEQLRAESGEGSARFKRIANRKSAEQLMRIAWQAAAYAEAVFARERVELTEAKAREIVLAFFRGQKYQRAKELVLAAAFYVKAWQLAGSIISESGATWGDAFISFELASWFWAIGSHHEIDVIRGTRAATSARQSVMRKRIDRLVEALTAGSVRATPRAVMRWRGEANTTANYERTRRDLRQAQYTIAARKTRD
jgi:hypothetical protein